MTLSLDGIVRNARWFNVIWDGFTLIHQIASQGQPSTRRQQVLFANDSFRVLLDGVCANLDIDTLSQILSKENQDLLGRSKKSFMQHVLAWNHRTFNIPEVENSWRLHHQLTSNIENYRGPHRTLSYLEIGAGVTDIGHYLASTEPQNTKITLVMNLWTRASNLLKLESRVGADMHLKSNAFLNKIYIVSITINRIVKYGFKTCQFIMANRPAIEGAVNRVREQAYDSCTIQ